VRIARLCAAGAALLLAATAFSTTASAGGGRRKRVLVISQTKGFRHSSIPWAVGAVAGLGAITGQWEVAARVETDDEVATAVTAAGLRNIDLVFFANTTGNLTFTTQGRSDFYNWVRNGGAVAGVHSASDTFHGDPDFLDLIRGEFLTHGPQKTVEIVVQDPHHPATRGLPEKFSIHDEIYEFKNWERSRVHMLLSMHKHPQSGEPGDFPVAWTNRYGRGRMFYTSLGHREDVYGIGLYMQHLTGGLRWALGLQPGDDTPGNPIR
jgi:type 1 glutamine amidotransferase